MIIENKRAAQDCADMDEIRAEIDLLDENIITLIAQRFAYVRAAAKFKTSPDAVRAKARFETMLLQRRAWAEEQGLSPEVIEKNVSRFGQLLYQRRDEALVQDPK
ncbi:chorismate mutase [Serratia liquefaciens]|uniref:chorismate mutase n=1 Tax=Serratia liquefaciens TaxID=614 RepID=UPI0021D37C62|nr:chorismate mutase [Serratia liquefaciens]